MRGPDARPRREAPTRGPNMSGFVFWWNIGLTEGPYNLFVFVSTVTTDKSPMINHFILVSYYYIQFMGLDH